MLGYRAGLDCSFLPHQRIFKGIILVAKGLTCNVPLLN